MKKLLLAAAIAIVGSSANIHAGKTAKKVWAYFKIAYGAISVPIIIGQPLLGIKTLCLAGDADFRNELKGALSLHSLNAIAAGPTLMLPFSVLCIKSGLRDLRKLKKNDVPLYTFKCCIYQI